MKIAIIGYGVEGKANEVYFANHKVNGGEATRQLNDSINEVQTVSENKMVMKQQGSGGAESALQNEIEVIKAYKDEDYPKIMAEQYDLILRSPSVRPQAGFSSGTQYFFDHCPAPIIGVTGTKGKGTTCSMIAMLLEALGEKVFLVGNIGIPAIAKLDEIKKDDVVVYELSSFQLWDLTKSPHIAVVLGIAPDHLNVHRDFAEYVAAKGRIAEFQGKNDVIIYARNNAEARQIAEKSPGKKIPFPMDNVDASTMSKLLDNLTVPGQHNREDAEAAILAVAAYLGETPEMLIRQHYDEMAKALGDFKGLPHHIELVRKLNGVSYYDDSFSTAEPALEVALKAFPKQPIVLIAGGQDKGVDLTETKQIIFGAKNLEKVFLIGEIAEKLVEGEPENKFETVGTLEEAVEKAQETAEKIIKSNEQIETSEKNEERQKQTEDDGQKLAKNGPVVLLSPGAASLDMFKSYYERGDDFKRLVKEL